jgi:hypothetical protein
MLLLLFGKPTLFVPAWFTSPPVFKELLPPYILLYPSRGGRCPENGGIELKAFNVDWLVTFWPVTDPRADGRPGFWIAKY